jgi:hypothetical protein
MIRGSRATLIMFAVLAGLAVFVIYTNNADQAEATPEPSTYVWELTSDQVAELQVVDMSRQVEVTLSRDGAGLWKVESSRVGSGQVVLDAQAADPGQAEYGASLVSTIFLRRTLTETTELGQYGLMAPAWVVNVQQSDGAGLTMKVGHKTPTEDGYYVLTQDGPHPQIVAASALDPLFGFVAAPPVAATPVPTEAPASETATPEP